jgi:hypothetical protein
MPTAKFQPSFAGGVLGPALHGRIDMAKYDVGLKTGVNVFIHAHGGVSNRAGFEYIGEVMDHDIKHRLIAFERDDDENFVLVMGDEEMKIIHNGAFIESGGSEYTTTTPFTEDMLFDLSFTQSVDVMYFAHQSLYPVKMLRYDYTDYAFERIEINPTIATEDWLNTSAWNGVENFDVNTASFGFTVGVGTPPSETLYTYFIVVEYGSGDSYPCKTKSVWNASTLSPLSYWNVLTWDAMPGAVNYHVYRKDGSDFYKLATVASGTEQYNDNGLGSIGTTPYTASDGNPPSGLSASSVVSDSNIERSWIYVVTAEYSSGESLASAPVATRNIYTLTANNYNTITWSEMPGAVNYHVYRKDGGFYYRLATIAAGTEEYVDDGTDSLDESKKAPTPISASAKSSDGSEDYYYVISPVIDGVEGFPCPPVSLMNVQDLSESDAKNTISWSGTGSVEYYNVYRKYSGIFGYIGFTEDEEFEDDNISPDTTTTPLDPAVYFETEDDYPAIVDMYQQRLVYASTSDDPEMILMSKVADYENFTRSRILTADDRVEMSISGSSVNRIRGMTQLRELLIFTSNGEFSVAGAEGYVDATNMVQTQYGYAGSAGVKPLVIEDTLLFIDRTGRQVRDLRYAYEQDGYSGNDLTIFASHFFEGKEIVDWTYQRNPFSIVWVVLDDGSLLAFTYKREHQVWAWTEQEIDGKVESVCSVNEGSEDALYVIIKRTIGGEEKRYIERLHSRYFDTVADAFFVDCGLTYEGEATTTVTGLDHLEGETVVALCDGSVVKDLVVSGGSVTVPVASEKIHVGLPYRSEIETLPPSIELKDVGNARGRPTKVSSVFIQMEDTRGIQVSGTGRQMAPFVLKTSDLGTPGEAYTGMQKIQLFPDWNRDGTVVITQDNPLPMSILGISPDFSVGRTS